MDKFILASYFKSYRPKADGSLSITFDTQEVTSSEVAELHDFRNKYGVLVFKAEDQLTEQEMKDLDALDLEYNGKSKSKILKNVLYVYFQNQNLEIDFDIFYANEMNKIIQH